MSIKTPQPLLDAGLKIVFGPTYLSDMASIPPDKTSWDLPDSDRYIATSQGYTPNRGVGMTLGEALKSFPETNWPERGIYIFAAGIPRNRAPLFGFSPPRAMYVGATEGDVFLHVGKCRIKLTGTHVGKDSPALTNGGVSHPINWQAYAIARFYWHDLHGNIPDICDDVMLLVMDFMDGSGAHQSFEKKRNEILKSSGIIESISELFWPSSSGVVSVPPILLNKRVSRKMGVVYEIGELTLVDVDDERICHFCKERKATEQVDRWDTWMMKRWWLPACSECAAKNQQNWFT